MPDLGQIIVVPFMGGGEVWSPPDLHPTTSPIWFWLQADLQAGANGDPQSTVTDYSGNNLHLTQTGTNRATLAAAHQNGKNTLRFTAANSQRYPLATTTLLGATGGSLYLVYKVISETVINGLINCGNSGNNGYWPHSDGKWYFEFGSTSWITAIDPAVSFTTDYRIISIYSDPQDWGLYIDGGAGGPSGGLNPMYQNPTNTVGWPATTTYIGATNDNLYRLDGWIAELIIVKSKQSAADRQRMEGYLAHKWGLTGNLSTLHPYKALPPAKVTPLVGTAASWWDALSDGDRRSIITLTTTAAGVAGAFTDLINGSLSTTMWWGNGNTNAEIKMDFGVGASVVIDGMGWRQDAGVVQGTWELVGSNDDSTYVNIPTTLGTTSFTLGSSGQGQVYYYFVNATGYRWYKFRQVGGSTSAAPYILEMYLRASSTPSVIRDPYEGGDRTGLINITTTATAARGTSVRHLIDGDIRPSLLGACFEMAASQTLREIKFDLLGVQKKITGLVLFQNGGVTQGDWVIEASNADSGYTVLATLTAFGNLAFDKRTWTNTTAYSWYKLRQTSGTTSDGPSLLELEFRITP